MSLSSSRFQRSSAVILMLLMAIIGYSKVYVILAMFYQKINSITDVMASAQYFFGGGLAGLLTFVSFNYTRSRRIYILLSELLYIAGLYLNNNFSDISDNSFIIFGASLSITLVIYPLYLSEQSYDDEKESLTIYLCYSLIISYIIWQAMILNPDQKENPTVMYTMCGLSLLSGCLINYLGAVKDTLTRQFMCGRIENGMNQISKIVKPGSRNFMRQYFFSMRLRKFQEIPQGTNYTYNNVQFVAIFAQIPIYIIQLLKKNQRIKTIQMTLLCIAIPLSNVYNFQYTLFQPHVNPNSNTLYPLDSTDRETQMAIVLLATLIGKFIVGRKNHFRMLDYGFQCLFFLTVIQIFEHMLSDPNEYSFLKVIQYCQFIVVQLTIEPVWRVMTINNVNPKFIWIHQLLFWAALLVSVCLDNEATALQAIGGLLGYFLASFL